MTRQRLRRMAIMRNCHNRNPEEIMPAGSQGHGISRHMFKNIIVNDKYRFLYCQVPKVATSNWKRVFMVLNGNASDLWKIKSADVHNTTRGYFRYLSEYTPSEIIVRLRNYYKFMFVRDPMERLASAYRNKFVEPYNLTFFPQIYGRYIIRKYRNGTNFRYSRTPEISFPEFIHYIIEDKDDVMDNHWRLYDDLDCIFFALLLNMLYHAFMLCEY